MSDDAESIPDSDSSYEIIDHPSIDLGPALTWLQPTDYTAISSEFKRHLTTQAPGTGLWICDTPRFQQWRDSEGHGGLWIKGVPGAGKSVVAASLVEFLGSGSRSGDNDEGGQTYEEHGGDDAPVVLYFFFRYIVVANRRPRGLIRDWLAQLLPHSPSLQSSLQPFIKDKLDEVSDEQLWEMLLIGLAGVKKAYCVVDALDEMERVISDQFLHRLNALTTFRPGNVKVLITSRPERSLQSELRDASIVHVSLESDLVGKDISAFVLHRLRNLLSGDSQEQALQESLVETICAKSRGLFLYARLLLDQITPMFHSTQSTRDLDVQKLADALPIGLEEMYNSMLFQQAETLKIDTSIQVFLLDCVTHSSRPLRLNELTSALACLLPLDTLPQKPKNIARLACAPLLEILEDETVQVIHHSVTEFLLDIERVNNSDTDAKPQFPILEPEMVHKKLALFCFKYLSSGALEANETTTGSEGGKSCLECSLGFRCTCRPRKDFSYNYQKARLQYPFLKYAIENWPYHASRYDKHDPEFFQSFAEFISSENPFFLRWVSLKWILAKGDIVTANDVPSALLIAAFIGLSTYVEYLLAQGVSPNPENAPGYRPIHGAARYNHYRIVKLLLEAGVDPLTPRISKHHLIRLESAEVYMGETAVYYACLHGHTETLVAMMPFLNAAGRQEALCESCRFGKVESVRAILEMVSWEEGLLDGTHTGATALYLACQAHSLVCVELLLEYARKNGGELDVNALSYWKPLWGISLMRPKSVKETALHGIMRSLNSCNAAACCAILQLLIAAGADLEAKNGNGETPLVSHDKNNFCVVARSTAVEVLLRAGSNVAAVDHDGNSILYQFLERSVDPEFVRLLLDFGASLSPRKSNGDTPFHVHLSSLIGTDDRSHEIVELLLDRGVDCNLDNNSGQSVLEKAVMKTPCSMRTFKLLIRSCTKKETLRRCLFEVRSRWYRNERAYEEKVEIIKEIISMGVSIDARDRAGATALLHNCKSEDTIEALLECGARLDAVDSNGLDLLGYFVLHSTGDQPSLARLEALVDLGFDPLRKDKNGNSILHHAVKSYPGPSSNEFMQRILQYGISVNTKNSVGQTPLHTHIEHESIYRYERVNRFACLLALFQETGKDKLEINAQDAEGVTPLHLAAMKSEVDVARLIKAGADATILTHTGRSILHLACRARKSNIIALLLHNFSEQLLDLTDFFGSTPLHDACVSGRPESVYYLLKSGANIHLKDNMGRTPLHSCAEFSNEKKIWDVREHQNIEAGQLESDRFRPYAGTRKQNAARHKSLLKYPKIPILTENETARIGGIVKSLLAAGADLDAVDTRDLTPLDVALSYGCLDMAKVLWSVMIARNPSCKSNPHYIRLQTILTLHQRVPISVQHPDIVTQELLRIPSHYLSILKDEDIKWILESLSDIPGPDRDSIIDALICNAAQRGLTEIIISIGSSAKAMDDSAMVQDRSRKPKISQRPLPLHAACKRELPNLETLEVLFEQFGADVNKHQSVDMTIYPTSLGVRKGSTALHYLAEARFWWQLDGIRLLVQKGANVNANNMLGETPLHIASRGNGVGYRSEDRGQDYGFWTPDCVHLLLDLGADPNALDKSGETPLQKAASRAPEIMEILLQRGADISGKTSPLFAAIEAQSTQTVQTLLAKGADPNAINVMKSCSTYFPVADEGRSALLCACFPHSGHGINSTTAIVKLLLQHGANVNMHLHTGETFLHYIFQNAPYTTIAAFLEYPSVLDLEARDQKGRTILLAACAWTSRGWITQNPDAKTGIGEPKSLMRAPVLALLDLGADISARDPQGRHALHCLLSNPYADDATVLAFLAHPLVQPLALQPSPITGITPLHCALETLRPRACFALMDLGADILARDPRNDATALHFVAAKVLETYICGLKEQILHPEGYLDDCLRLWEIYFERVCGGGESINARDGKGETPLFAYLRSKTSWYDFKWEEKLRLVGREKKKVVVGHVECFEEFFGGKAVDFCTRNLKGETILHILAGREEVDLEDRTKGEDKSKGYQTVLFNFLVEKGADPWAEDNSGRSAIDVAATMGKKGILGLFQAKS